jgi:hypothetical protein
MITRQVYSKIKYLAPSSKFCLWSALIEEMTNALEARRYPGSFPPTCRVER